LFEPQGPKHAIIEAVFGLQLARHFTASEIEALIAQHDKFKNDLPRVNRTQVIMLGGIPPGVSITPPTAGVSFDAMKRDGSLEWRLRAEDNQLILNCLAYSRWSEIWPRARDYLKAASEIVIGNDNHVRGILLQYVDVFLWKGDVAAYDPKLMLDPNSTHVPKSILECGPMWHLHQGWYRDDSLPEPGRLLERLHLNAIPDDTGVPTVKVDTYLQLELANEQSVVSLFQNTPSMIENAFKYLHNDSKALLKSFLTDELAKRIDLQ